MATNKAASTKKKAPAKKVVSKKTASAAVTKRTVKTTSVVSKRQPLGKHIESSLLSSTLWRALGAEFIGTFLLAAVIIAGQGQPIFVLFGLAGIVLLLGALSGAHFNPAITIGAWVTRRIGWLRALGYIFVQLLGAAAAFFMLSAFIGGAPQPTEEQQLYGQAAPELFKAVDIATIAGKEWFVFFAELIGTAILGFAIASAAFATRNNENNLANAFAIGFGIFIALMVTITVAGFVSASAIINPAVALSLQAYGGTVWAYIAYALAPVIGGVVGFVLYDLLRGKQA